MKRPRECLQDTMMQRLDDTSPAFDLLKTKPIGSPTKLEHTIAKQTETPFVPASLIRPHVIRPSAIQPYVITAVVPVYSASGTQHATKVQPQAFRNSIVQYNTYQQEHTQDQALPSVGGPGASQNLTAIQRWEDSYTDALLQPEQGRASQNVLGHPLPRPLDTAAGNVSKLAANSLSAKNKCPHGGRKSRCRICGGKAVTSIHIVTCKVSLSRHRSPPF